MRKNGILKLTEYLLLTSLHFYITVLKSNKHPFSMFFFFTNLSTSILCSSVSIVSLLSLYVSPLKKLSSILGKIFLSDSIIEIYVLHTKLQVEKTSLGLCICPTCLLLAPVKDFYPQWGGGVLMTNCNTGSGLKQLWSVIPCPLFCVIGQ